MTDSDDRKNQICTKCGVGNYQETNIYDDWDGVLHCTNKECNHEVKRYKWKDNPPPKLEKVKLSAAAQAVASAYDNTPEKDTGNHRYLWLAAALRSAVTQVTPVSTNARQMKIRDEFLAIADELQAISI
jgi:hypothetical protein